MSTAARYAVVPGLPDDPMPASVAFLYDTASSASAVARACAADGTPYRVVRAVEVAFYAARRLP